MFNVADDQQQFPNNFWHIGKSNFSPNALTNNKKIIKDGVEVNIKEKIYD